MRKMGNHIKIVSGKTGYALYNLKSGNVYHLNNEAYQVIQRYLLGEDYFNEDEQLIINELNGMDFCKDLLDNIKTDISPKLSYVWLELTEACNLNCIHCYGEWGYKVDEKKQYLNLSEWKIVIDDIYSLGCRKIQFIGGEPLMYPYFQELLIYAHKKGMKQIDVFTNGTLLNDILITLFKELGVNVRVSLYGHNAEIHDRITKRKGSFNKTLSNIRKMQNANIQFQIAVIIMDENENYISDIKEFIGLFGSYGYDTIRQTTFGTQLKHAVNDSKILSERYQCYADFYVKQRQYYLNLNWNNCWFGKIAITSNGDILPCIFARECVLGNIKCSNKIDIEKKVLTMWGLTKDKVEGCKICEYRYACHDCRPIAKGLTGNIYAKYPRCCYDPECGNWNDISKITLEINKLHE